MSFQFLRRVAALSVLFGVAVGAQAIARPIIPPVVTPPVTYSLTLNGCSSGCGTGPYGTVTVSQDALTAGALDVSVILGDGYSFRHANDSHHAAFSFDLLGNPQITMSSFSSSVFSRGTDNLSLSPYGVMEYSIGCASKDEGPTCSPGVNGHNPTTLSFIVTSQTGALTLSSLLANPDGYLFTVDVVNNGTCAGCTSGSTGNVAATAATLVTNQAMATPEPASVALFGTGLLALGGLIYRRRRA